MKASLSFLFLYTCASIYGVPSLPVACKMKQIDLLESSMLILKLDFNKKKLGVKKGKKKKRLVGGWVGVGWGWPRAAPS